jgi:hypothetical protein
VEKVVRAILAALILASGFAIAPAANALDPAEELAWEMVQNSADTAPLEAFLARFPDGAHAVEAQDKLDSLNAEGAPIGLPAGEWQKRPLGVSIRDVNTDRARELAAPTGYAAEVTKVDPDSIAEAAGLMPGDVVISAGFTRTMSANDLKLAIGDPAELGGLVVLEVWRADPTIERGGAVLYLNADFGECRYERMSAEDVSRESELATERGVSAVAAMFQLFHPGCNPR